MSRSYNFLTGTAAPYSSGIYIDGATQRVGVGTTSPDYKLHVVGRIYATEDVTVSSDARVKQDLEPIDDALGRVSRLTGYTFTRQGASERQAGLIAQDVQAVLPEAVSVAADTGLLSVAYGSGLTALLVEAVKELVGRVDDLERRLSESKE